MAPVPSLCPLASLLHVPCLGGIISNLPEAAAAELLFYFISFISHNLQDPHLYCPAMSPQS